jgi:hypothetical protein
MKKKLVFPRRVVDREKKERPAEIDEVTRLNGFEDSSKKIAGVALRGKELTSGNYRNE